MSCPKCTNCQDLLNDINNLLQTLNANVNTFESTWNQVYDPYYNGGIKNIDSIILTVGGGNDPLFNANVKMDSQNDPWILNMWGWPNGNGVNYQSWNLGNGICYSNSNQ